MRKFRRFLQQVSKVLSKRDNWKAQLLLLAAFGVLLIRRILAECLEKERVRDFGQLSCVHILRVRQYNPYIVSLLTFRAAGRRTRFHDVIAFRVSTT